ncbi:MAG: AI-2E family transporter [Candidatus Parcubacteria bacterium]|nr:AI-2E family transporter [Candidatus Parcubacteria bacterium]
MDEERPINYISNDSGGTSSRILDISWASILKIIFALGLLYFVFLIRDILIWFVFALVISILFNPAINFLRKFHIPRVLAAILVYLSIFVLLSCFIYTLAPLLFSELQHFTTNIPGYFEQASPYLSGLKIEALKNFQSFAEVIGKGLYSASNNIFSAIGMIFGGLASTIVIFSIAFFLSLEEEGLSKAVMLIFPPRYKSRISAIWQKSQKKVAAWFGVRIICCLFIGIVIGIACYSLNIKYAVLFGLLAGVFNMVVTIGPFLSGTAIALFVLITMGMPKAIIFIIIFFIAQGIENYVIMPLLTKRFMQLSPSLVLISLLIGARLWGLLGAILIIPLMGMIFEFAQGFLERREAIDQQLL